MVGGKNECRNHLKIILKIAELKTSHHVFGIKKWQMITFSEHMTPFWLYKYTVSFSHLVIYHLANRYLVIYHLAIYQMVIYSLVKCSGEYHDININKILSLRSR